MVRPCRRPNRIGAQAPRLRTTKGVHIACEPFTSHAIFLESAVDGRAVFAIPWMGHTWIGTTDTDFDGDPATASATAEDVRYLIESVAPQLPAVRTAKKYWTCAGVRALVRSDGSPSGVSRMHQITTAPSGLVSIIGSKLTGYRAIAEDVVDIVGRQLGHDARCTTSSVKLPGANGEPAGLADGDLAAHVTIAVRHQWCQRLEDFVFRRSALGFQPDQGAASMDTISHVMQQALDWSEARRLEEVAACTVRMAHDRRPLGSIRPTDS